MMTSRERKEQLTERKREIAGDLIVAMRNHPPSKQEMKNILVKIREAFPELEALKAPMSRLPGKITASWFQMLPIYDTFSIVEKNLKKKPLHPERAKTAFAHLYYLATLLFFKDDLQRIGEKGEVIEGARTRRQICAEQIQLNLLSANALFRRVSKSSKALVFREDVSHFFVRLPTECKGKNDFTERLQSLSALFEVDLAPLRELLPSYDREWKSITLLEKWFLDKGAQDYDDVTNIWRNIVRLRNIPPTHARFENEAIDAIHFLGGHFPIEDFSLVWDSIIDHFLGSLLGFQAILEQIMCIEKKQQ